MIVRSINKDTKLVYVIEISRGLYGRAHLSVHNVLSNPRSWNVGSHLRCSQQQRTPMCENQKTEKKEDYNILVTFEFFDISKANSMQWKRHTHVSWNIEQDIKRI